MLGYDSLMNYFKTNFSLMQYHKYSLSDIENMMPWEKFIYVDMLNQYIKHQEDLNRDQAAQRKAQANIKRR
jgi:3-methyladenine DNA glycosylase AlkD